MKLGRISRIVSVLLTAILVLTSLPMSAAKKADAIVSAPAVYTSKDQSIALNPGKDNSYYHITWNSYSADQSVRWVEYDKTVNGVFPSEYYTCAADQSDGNGTCRARITDIKSNTAYAYSVGSNETGWSKTRTFTTGDFDDNAFSFLFMGDPQVGGNGLNYDQKLWNQSVDQAQNWFGDDIEFIMSAGDQVNAGNSRNEYDVFFSPEWLHSLPLITTVGNHDEESPLYSNYFTYTDIEPGTCSNAGKYSGDYWIEYDGVLIINLNKNLSSLSYHSDFVRNAISEFKELYGEPVWKIVTYHDSPFSAAKLRFLDENEERDEYTVLFSQLGIDAVLTGHDHIYTRTFMIDGVERIKDPNAYDQIGNDPYASITDPDESMVVYISANSSSGSKFYEMENVEIPFAACKNQENVPNMTKVDVTPDSLVFTTYRTGVNNEIGDVVDFFAIHRTAEEDNYAPSLNVPEKIYYSVADGVDVMKGISAYDNVDGVITDRVVTDGHVSVTEPVTITYTVTDKAGNTAEAKCDFIPLKEDVLLDGETTEWKYLDGGEKPYEDEDDENHTWATEAYDDSQWKTGTSSFGAIGTEVGNHDGIVPTTLLDQYFPYGHDDEGYPVPTFFFRTTFDLEDPESISALYCDFYYEDACSIFINGVEVEGFNTDTLLRFSGYSGNTAPIDKNFGAIRITDKSVIDSLNLKETGNVLSARVHQSVASNTGDDILFHFEYLYLGRQGMEFPFTDVKTEAWYYAAVTRSYYKDLFVGTSDTLFSPDATMTRAMVWTVLARISTADITSDGGPWYKGAQDWAVQSGVSDGTYPDDNITRQQLVAMLYRLKGNPATEGNIDSFSDKDQVADWAKDAMIWAVTQGLMKGRTEDTLAPEGNATRAEACTLILKYLNNQ